MIIVGNNNILKNFKKIKEFKIDMGDSLTKSENIGDSSHPNFQTVFKTRDDFIRKYHNITNKFIFKYGNIGTLNIYTDQTINNNTLSFFTDDDRLYNIEYKNQDDFRNFINECLEKVTNMEMSDKKIQYEESEKENYKKSTKDMSKEELIDFLLKKRKEM